MTKAGFCVLDFETRSEAELKRTGAWEYAVHPSTRILCVGWKLGAKGETRVWSPAFPNEAPIEELLAALRDPEVKIIAHNALFEQAIVANVLPRVLKGVSIPSVPPERWVCTAALAAVLALPRSLEGACAALGLPVQKDMDGRKLMLKYSKPRKPTKNNPALWHDSAKDLRRIMDYCRTDVEAEALLYKRLPPLTPTERKVWELDQEMNLRGFLVDRPLVLKVLAMLEVELKRLGDEMTERTGLLSAAQRDATLKWLKTQGVELLDLSAKTVADALAFANLPEGTRRVLEIRQAASKTSTAKYAAFEERTRSDGRCRDILVYHAASTGRWAGAGVQPHNFPKGTIKDTDAAAEDLSTGDLEWIRFLYGDPMPVFSSCLRSMIMASPGTELVAGDYATIEVRVLFWLADHEAGLDMFRSGEDLYKHMASNIYNVAVKDVTTAQRQLGKGAVLGCGFGMGHKKFHQTCVLNGQMISEYIAKVAVNAYRTTHHPVVTMWQNIERVCVRAIKEPGKRFRVNHTTWWVKDDYLWCELPGGRCLAYAHPRVKHEPVPWSDDETRPVVYHHGVDPLTRKWAQAATYGGKLVENITQAVARDLLAEALLRLKDSGYTPILSVHDEVICEQKTGQWSLERFERVMSEPPSWAAGLPIAVEGWVGKRYRK